LLLEMPAVFGSSELEKFVKTLRSLMKASALLVTERFELTFSTKSTSSSWARILLILSVQDQLWLYQASTYLCTVVIIDAPCWVCRKPYQITQTHGGNAWPTCKSA